MISTVWISFVHDLDPISNAFSEKKGINKEGLQWPVYGGKTPSNTAFDVNVTA
jgi:triacylglycerol lipase